MEDELTQPGIKCPFCSEPVPLERYYALRNTAYTGDLSATQLILDPRRLGQHASDLSDDDLADIFCILHPVSVPAVKAAALIHTLTPEHTITAEDNVNIREKSNDPQDVGTFELAEKGLKRCDIALRLSAKTKTPHGGFLFGRNQQRCDFILGLDDDVKRVSNIHFRIYINEYGIIMLEDQSTNGTAVDGQLLRAREKENNIEFKHMLELGSRIVLHMTPPEEDFRFIVRIPRRDEAIEEIYQENLTNYFMRIQNAVNERKARAVGNREPPNLFPSPDVVTQAQSTSSLGRYVREWKGGHKYNKVGVIGKGAFAVVYKLTDKYNGVPFAAKELEKRRFMKNGVLDQKVDTEMTIMSQIKHQHIVQYIEHIDYDPYLYIIMEYVPGGDLGSMIGRHGRVEEPRVQLMAAQILDALDYLHGKGITHRDVKPDNILIHSHSPFQVKLTDFGLSKIVDTEETFLRTFCGTLLYCAPEVYSEYREYDLSGKRSLRGVDKKLLPPQRYDHAVDIWSLAGVLFFSLCASPPYPAKNGISYQELLNLIMTQPLDIKPLQKVNISDQGIRFVRSMLHNRPEHRATIADLQRHPWLTGASQDSVDEDMYIDDEADEVDLIQSGSILEQEASQLSLHEPMDDDVSDLTEVQQVEIPNSFNTSDGISNGNESYGFMQNAGNGRLFGEVDASVLGSSGAIPIEQLPVPTVNRRPSNDENPSRDAHHTQPTIIVPPRLPNLTATQVATRDADERVTRSSSLMGAESMVGHLNMHSPAANSPAAAMSPGADTPSPAADNISLRRAHDAISVTEGEWRPDLPPSKRRKSTRAIDLPATPQMFWDPKDKSTHHYNYPRMSIAEWNTYQELAQERGEVFDHGHSIFESTLASFRTSRSPSLEPERARIQSEPIPDEGKRGLKRDEGNIGRMRRDERDFGFISSDERSELGLMKRDGQEPKDTGRAARLTDGPRRRSADMAPIGVGKGNEERELQKKVERKRRLAIDPQLTAPKDQSLPATAHGSNQPSPHETNVAASHGVVGNDFQPPKRILGKIISTPDSCLPTISLNIVDTVTSWGRGYLNTMRYSNAQETRVPKYAFKIFAFKTDNDWASTGAPAHGFETTGLTFYISTKASAGIFVNTVKVSSHDAHNPETASKYWGEIRHGDLITVWWHDKDFKPYTRLRFECYHGESKVPRKEGEKFQLLKDEAFIKQLNNACDVHENEILHTLGNTS